LTLINEIKVSLLLSFFFLNFIFAHLHKLKGLALEKFLHLFVGEGLLELALVNLQIN